MARISTYNLDEKVNAGDKWIGSDSDFYNKTKNFTPLRLAEFLNSSESINISNSLRFWYQTLDPFEERMFGTLSFKTELGGLISFDSITSILISKKTEGGIYVNDFLFGTNNSKILIHNSESKNDYGLYEVTSISEDLDEEHFLVFNLIFIKGNGSLIEDKSYLFSVADYQFTHEETDPIFQASEASLFEAGDKLNLDNQSGVNTGDETTSSIQLKRPIKTINNESLEGVGNIDVDVTGLVPYIGATQDVDLGEFELKAGQVEFDQTPTGTAGVGVIRWNDSDGTLDLGLKGGNVTLQLGQEQVLRVVNKTATNISLLESNYQAVRVTGAQGQRLKVDLAQATNDLLSAETIGLVTETIANNQEGFITTSGLIRGINTTGSLQGETWVDGDVLYLSPTIAGRITNVKPQAPNHLVIIGYVVHAHANQGSIFVKVDNGYELEELHNVTSTNYTTPIDTDSLLTYDITNSLWKRLSWSNIKSNLKTYFDGIYTTTSAVATQITTALSGYATQSWVTSQGYITNVITALGFTPENIANKSTLTTLGTSDILYPTQNAVKTYVDNNFVRTLIKDVNFSSNLTGTTSPILGKSYLIPGGIIKTGNIVKITVRGGNIGGDYGSTYIRVNIGTLPFGTQILLSTATFEGFMETSAKFQIINATNDTGFRGLSTVSNQDEGYNRGYTTLSNINWDVNQTIGVFVVNSVSGRISVIRMVEILIT